MKIEELYSARNCSMKEMQCSRAAQSKARR